MHHPERKILGLRPTLREWDWQRLFLSFRDSIFRLTLEITIAGKLPVREEGQKLWT